MSPTHPPTFVIIGAGSRGTGYARYLKKHPERGKIVAVADPRDFYRKALQNEHAIPDSHCFHRWEDCLARERLADAIVIATTDRLHTEPAIAAAERGYHILLEKPMAPTVEECSAITNAVQKAGVLLVVCHVLRYAAFYKAIKHELEQGTLGDLCSIQHFEGIAWWHFAHSFVRGNFGNEARSSFSLLAKSCHDLDLLRWWADRRCERVSSFGSLKHFRRECAPEGSGPRCMDCSLADGECPYSAKAYYFGQLREGHTGWPLDMVVEEPNEADLEKALREGPYGQCVYRCDNDVVDTQVVNCEFEGGLTASMTMSAFTPHGRKVRIMGSHGYLEGDEQTLKVLNFKTGQWTEQDVNKLATDLTGGHGGGDQGLMDAFTDALITGDRHGIKTGPEISLESHRMVFAAEQARRQGRVIEMHDF